MASEVVSVAFFYSNTTIINFKETALFQLLEQSRGFNEYAGITGVLRYGGGRFRPVLEGCLAAGCGLSTPAWRPTRAPAALKSCLGNRKHVIRILYDFLNGF